MIKAAQIISKKYSGAILVKGGHLTKTADDLLLINNECIWFKNEKINNIN